MQSVVHVQKCRVEMFPDRNGHTEMVQTKTAQTETVCTETAQTKMKHHFPYTVVPTPHEQKQFHESEYNSHESEMFPTTNSILTQKQVGC